MYLKKSASFATALKELIHFQGTQWCQNCFACFLKWGTAKGKNLLQRSKFIHFRADPFQMVLGVLERKR